MAKTRIPETDCGIEGEFTVELFNRMQRRHRDKGWIETQDLIKNGIAKGIALEIGPGPGYLGLEWLKHTRNTSLKGLDISSDMIAVAERNAGEYGLSQRAEYIQSSGEKLPFDDGTFDAVFTNGSLHEWENPQQTFKEMWRVLKTGGRFFVSDLRRDMSVLIKSFLWLSAKPKEIRPGLITSINAAYTPDELKALVRDTPLAQCDVVKDPIGLKLLGQKEGDPV